MLWGERELGKGRGSQEFPPTYTRRKSLLSRCKASLWGWLIRAEVMHQTASRSRREMRWKWNVYKAIKIKTLDTLIHKGMSSLFISTPWFQDLISFHRELKRLVTKDHKKWWEITPNIKHLGNIEGGSSFIRQWKIQTKTKQEGTVCAYFCAHRNVCRLFRFYHIVITYITGKAHLCLFVTEKRTLNVEDLSEVEL